jgi:methylglutaconyl-CoA hydratase
MSEPLLLQEESGAVLTLTLNRPEKRNALSGALVTALEEALERARNREEIRVILLRGAGTDFCAGADLAELEGMLEATPEESLADAQRLGDLLMTMRGYPKPIVAVVQGRALAGGCGLATACDLVLAREGAEFGYPEVHLGFVPAMVMAILRRKMLESQAFDLVATGRRISALEARQLGLVNRVFPDSEFLEGVTAFSRDLARRPPSALSLTKGLLYEQADLSVVEGVARGAEVNVEARSTEACREGVRKFLSERRSKEP